MAYTLSDDEDPQAQAQKRPAAPAPQAPVPAPQPAQAPAPAQPQAQAAPQAPAPAASPSSFISFDRYLGANYGKANQAAQGIAKRVGDQAFRARDDIQHGSEDFSRQVAHGGKGAAYAGPTDFNAEEGGSNLDSEVMDANTSLHNIASDGGLQNYFQGGFGAQSAYSPGMSRFDAALTGGAGRRNFEDLRQKYAGLDDALSAARARAAGEVTDAQNYVAPPPPEHHQDLPTPHPPSGPSDGGFSNQHIHNQRDPHHSGSGNWDGGEADDDSGASWTSTGPASGQPTGPISDDKDDPADHRKHGRNS
jgi:hypothetical protein